MLLHVMFGSRYTPSVRSKHEWFACLTIVYMRGRQRVHHFHSSNCLLSSNCFTMAASPFGLSVTDIALFCNVIRTAVDAVQKSGKTSREYKQLRQHLFGLESQIRVIEELKSTEAQTHPHCNALLENAVKDCENTLNDFSSRHQKHLRHLGHEASNKPHTSWKRLNEMMTKIHWAQFHANDIKQLQDQLIVHIELISVALQIWKLWAQTAPDAGLMPFC